MNTTRNQIRRTGARAARLTVFVAGLACFVCFPWDTPLVAGRVGCLVLGVRVWVVGLALFATAAVWTPDESVERERSTRQPRKRVVTAAQQSAFVVHPVEQRTEGKSSHLVA